MEEERGFEMGGDGYRYVGAGDWRLIRNKLTISFFLFLADEDGTFGGEENGKFGGFGDGDLVRDVWKEGMEI